MFQRRTRSAVRSALIAALALLAISAGSVAADTTPAIGGTFTQNGTSADVFASACEPGAGDTTTVGVASGKSPARPGPRPSCRCRAGATGGLACRGN